MEVFVLELYNVEENLSYIVKIFEDFDVGMNFVKMLDKSYTWDVHQTYAVASNNTDIIYYLHKKKVVLDEMPNNKLFK
jgi:hypothetical protein